MLVQGLTPYFDGPYHQDRNHAEKIAKRQEMADMVSSIVGQEPTIMEDGERVWTTGGWTLCLPDYFFDDLYESDNGFGNLTIPPSSAE